MSGTDLLLMWVISRFGSCQGAQPQIGSFINFLKQISKKKKIILLDHLGVNQKWDSWRKGSDPMLVLGQLYVLSTLIINSRQLER